MENNLFELIHDLEESLLELGLPLSNGTFHDEILGVTTTRDYNEHIWKLSMQVTPKGFEMFMGQVKTYSVGCDYNMPTPEPLKHSEGYDQMVWSFYPGLEVMCLIARKDK